MPGEMWVAGGEELVAPHAMSPVIIETYIYCNRNERHFRVIEPLSADLRSSVF